MDNRDSRPSGPPRIDPRSNETRAAEDAPPLLRSAAARPSVEDDGRARGEPPAMTMRGAPVTLGVILFCCAVYAVSVFGGVPMPQLWSQYGYVIYSNGSEFLPLSNWGLLTHAALHGGLLHLGFNMVALAAFGPPPERSVGPPAYLATLLLAAVAGALAHYGWIIAFETLDPPGRFPALVGASGAICGVLALEFYRRFLFLRMARRRLAEGPSPLGYLVKMSALFIGLNLAISILPGFISGQAHIGGYLVGLLLAPLIMRRPAP